jgi:hypothetical protein
VKDTFVEKAAEKRQSMLKSSLLFVVGVFFVYWVFKFGNPLAWVCDFSSHPESSSIKLIGKQTLSTATCVYALQVDGHTLLVTECKKADVSCSITFLPSKASSSSSDVRTVSKTGSIAQTSQHMEEVGTHLSSKQQLKK